MSDDLVKVTVSEGKYTFGQRKDGSCYALRYGEPWREDIFDGLTLAMAHHIEVLEAKLEKAVEGQKIKALEQILEERGAVFDAMVDAAEEAAGKDVSFNVVVGRTLRAALAELNGAEWRDVMTLTLQTIRDHSLCTDGWKRLTKAVGSDLKTELSIGDVLISNGLYDALWCLQCLEPRQRVAAVMPAVKRASVHTTDQRVHDCIAAIDKWLAGDDTVDLNAAAKEATRAAARRAAGAAEWAAEAAGGAAGGAAERKLQEADLLAMFPPMILKGQDDA